MSSPLKLRAQGPYHGLCGQQTFADVVMANPLHQDMIELTALMAGAATSRASIVEQW